jgi:ABC-type multidrug transport system fused ATPase/permease subunit
MRTGDIMARATNDLNAVRMLLGPAIMYSANTLVLHRRGAGLFMISISPKLTFYTFLPLPVVSIVIQSIFRPARFTSVSNAFRRCSPTFRRAPRRIFPARG